MHTLGSLLSRRQGPRRALLWPTAALVVSACAVGPDYRGPPLAARPPATFIGAGVGATTAAAADDAWWRNFRDPVLDALVETALRGNPGLEAAEARVRHSREGIVAARSGLLPAANASARVSDDKLSRNGENLALIPFTPRTTEFTDYRLGLDASWEIDLAGHARREIEAAIARFGSAEETRNDARLVIAAEVAATYVDFLGAARRLEIARRLDAQADQALALVRLQHDAGIVGDPEYLQALAQQRAAAATVAAAEGSVQPALFALAALSGEPFEAVRSRVQSSAPVPVPPGSIPVGLPSDLLRRRPDVRRAERDLAGATAAVGAAVAAQFPRLSLVGAAGFDSIRTGDLTSAASHYWTMAPQLTLPLFAGGRLRSDVRSAQADLDAAIATYRNTVLQALADVESCIVRYAAAATRHAALAAAAGSLAESVAAVRRRQAAGDVSMLDVLAAERTADEMRDQTTAAAMELARSYVALNKALGGGWQRP